MSVGRDGASDAVSFLRAGIPAVEFGASGGGHHGPDEWVSISSLARYRQALTEFVLQLPKALDGKSARCAPSRGACRDGVGGGGGASAPASASAYSSAGCWRWRSSSP